MILILKMKKHFTLVVNIMILEIIKHEPLPDGY